MRSKRKKGDEDEGDGAEGEKEQEEQTLKKEGQKKTATKEKKPKEKKGKTRTQREEKQKEKNKLELGKKRNSVKAASWYHGDTCDGIRRIDVELSLYQVACIGWYALSWEAIGILKRANEGREIRTPNLLIWSQTRCRCAIPP